MDGTSSSFSGTDRAVIPGSPAPLAQGSWLPRKQLSDSRQDKHTERVMGDPLNHQVASNPFVTYL